MAKQTGPRFITGTIGIACFYKSNGQYYLRRKSSLSAETVRDSPAFANSRRSAGQLARASKIASGVYRSLPKESRQVALYRKMTGLAKKMLRDGQTEPQVRAALLKVKLPKSSARRARQRCTPNVRPSLFFPAMHKRTGEPIRYFKFWGERLVEIDPGTNIALKRKLGPPAAKEKSPSRPLPADPVPS